jgi:hypothetical protein
MKRFLGIAIAALLFAGNVAAQSAELPAQPEKSNSAVQTGSAQQAEAAPDAAAGIECQQNDTSPMVSTVLDGKKKNVDSADCFVQCAGLWAACKAECVVGDQACFSFCFQGWQDCKWGCSYDPDIPPPGWIYVKR